MRRFKIRFSLRKLLIAVTIGCVALGWRESIRRRHYAAVRSLQKPSVVLYDSFEDPIGPNCLWRLDLSSSEPPANGYFSDYFGGEWFANSPFCIRGYWRCFIQGGSRDDLKVLRDLVNLEFVQLDDVGLLAEDIQLLGECRALKFLTVNDDGLAASAVPYLSALKQLDSLVLLSRNLSSEDIKRVKAALPRCRVEWDKGD